MAEKHYVKEVGTIVLVDCGCNILGATSTKLKVKKPDGIVVEWAATIEGTNYLKYTIQAGDLGQIGRYYVQASLALFGWSGRGETDSFIVYEPYR